MNNIIEERLSAHIETIEVIYGIKILNKEEVIEWIANSTDDEKNALTFATSLNTWVMMNSSGGSINIPLNALKQIQDNLKLIKR
jgi:hypothetical protein